MWRHLVLYSSVEGHSCGFPSVFHLERLFLPLFWVFHSPGHPAPNTGLYDSQVTELRDILNPFCPASRDQALGKKILKTFAGLQTRVREVDKRANQVTDANRTTCLICLPQASKADAVRVAPTPATPCWASLRPLVVATCGFAEQMLPTHCVPLSFLLSPFCPTSCFFHLPCLVSGFPILAPGGEPSGPWLWGPATTPCQPPPTPPPGTSSVPAPAMEPLRASPALADRALGPASSCVRDPTVASCPRSPGLGLAPHRSAA